MVKHMIFTKTSEGSTGKKGTCHRFDKATNYFSSIHFPTTIFSRAAKFWFNN